MDADVVAVGPAARYQAARLSETLPFPLLLDPEFSLHKALKLRRQSLLAFFLNIAGWVRYLKAFGRHRRQGRFTGNPRNLPAVAIVTPGGEVQWLHQGRSVADYPEPARVVAQLGEHR